MPASMTAEYDLTGLGTADLYAKFRAAMIESGAVIYDEYVSGGTYYLVEKITTSTTPIYGRWNVTSRAISSPALYPTWTIGSTPGGLTSTNGTITAALGTSFNIMRIFNGPGYRLMFAAPNTAANSSSVVGWMAPVGTPPGWDTSICGYVVGMAISNSNITIASGTQVAGRSYGGTLPSAPIIDSLLTGAIGRYPPFLSSSFSLHSFPSDFLVISGRSTNDFPSIRDCEYSIMVGTEVQTHRPLFVTANCAYVLRMK